MSRGAGANTLGGVGCCGGPEFGGIAIGRETEGCDEVGWDGEGPRIEGSANKNLLSSNLMCRAV